MEEVILKVGDNEYGGWKNISINKSITNIAGSFGLVATDIFPGQGRKWNIKMGDECTVQINDQIIITGYIDEIPLSYDANSHSIQYSGRDVTGDLVDCCYDGTVTEWLGQTIEDVIKNLCSPFNIDVEIHSSATTQASKTLESELVQQGMTIYEMIIEICNQYALLPVCYGDGKLTLTQAGTSRTTDDLEFGKNILAGNIVQSNVERYSKYTVQGTGRDSDSIIDILQISGDKVFDEYEDPLLKEGRHRPLVILSERATDKGKCREEAIWECNKRAAKSRMLNYTVQGWTQSDGKVWPLNSIIKVTDEFLGINKSNKGGNEFLITDLSFSIDDQGGTITNMSLVGKEAYSLMENIVIGTSGFDSLNKFTGQ